jgi:hypothetical protein
MKDTKSLVYALLAKIGVKPHSEIREEDRLLQDLRVGGDDYGMWFVKEVERQLSMKAPLEEWNRVQTVKDILNIVNRHADASGT